MSRYGNAFDESFETVTGLDGKPTRVLKDKGRVRISMTMRDAVVGTGSHGPRGEAVGDLCTINGTEGRLRKVNGDMVCVPLRSSDAKAQFTDGRTTDPTALNRPGFRVPVVNDRRAVNDAYTAYETSLTNAYREATIPKELVEKRIAVGDPDPVSDSRTLDQHRQTMDRLYRERDELDANAWRGR